MIVNMSSADDMVTIASRCLLPNEFISGKVDLINGFLFLTDRRLVQVEATGLLSYNILRALHYDCIIGIAEKKSDEIELIGAPVDPNGRLEAKTRKIMLKKQKEGMERSSDSQLATLDAALLSSRLDDMVQNARKTSHSRKRNDNYLNQLPGSLTKSAILDLNAILQDKPFPDELYHEAARFLGADPFLLEESLRDADDLENGVLFAAGDKGCIWIRGFKRGRFMRDVRVERIEWQHIKCNVHQWQYSNDPMTIIYILQENGADKRLRVCWDPSIQSDSLEYPWLFHSANGPWILADLFQKYTGHSLRTSYPSSDIDDSRLQYYL